MRSSWDAYVLEMLMIGGLLVYALNFIAGRSKNARLATAWYQAHREILEANFSVVGATKQLNFDAPVFLYPYPCRR